MKRILLTSLLTITTLLINAQCLIKHVPLHTKITNASLVVEGKVISKTSFWDAGHQNIYTKNKVEIYKIFKGNVVGSHLEVITEGGQVGTDLHVVDPSLNLKEGHVGVLALNPTNVNVPGYAMSGLAQFDAYASLQGFIKYDLNNMTASAPFESFSDVATVLYPSLNAITHQTYQTVKKVSFQQTQSNQVQSGHTISNISPTIATSGTNTQLTITGSGFGATQGASYVEFANADDGGATKIAPIASEYVSWSDNTIIVEIPTDAGTGTVDVVVAATPVTSGQTLTISYARLNVTFDLGPGDVTYVTTLIDDNASGGYTFQMHSDFAANTSANNSFVRAVDEWRCNTGANFTIGGTTATDVVASDGINIVRFDNGGELPGGVLGRCTSRRSGCGSGPMSWYVTELDIQFDDGTSWEYGPALPGFSDYDFETVAVHELGHGHQLGHVISPGAIMHYSISNGSSNRDLGVNDLAGGSAIQTESKATTPCSQGAATDYVCGAVPVTNFSANQTNICSGSNVTFSDLSSNTPTSWSWTFEGGIPATSSAQNPVVTYNNGGVYTVTLIATNASGSDDEVKVGYITVDYCPKLQGGYCGMNLVDFYSTVWSEDIPSATQYGFRVTHAASGYADSATNTYRWFRLSNLPGVQYGKTYEVEVKAYIGGVWTDYGDPCNVTTPAAIPGPQLYGGYCGITLSSFSGTVYSELVQGATQYKFRVSHAGSGYADSAASNYRWFRLSDLAGVQYGKTYTVEVRALVGGVWGNYGGVCNVTMPAAIPTPKLQGGYCGIVLSDINNTIWSEKTTGATMYRFRVTGLPGYNDSLTTSYRYFRFTQLTPGYLASTIYNVEVKAMVGGVWGNYGVVCNATTPGTIIVTQPGSPSHLDGSLTQIEKNGENAVIEDGQSSIINPIIEFNASIYPNPTNTGDIFLNINTPSDGMATVQLTDIMGRHIFSENLALNSGGNIIKQNYSSLGIEKGMYLINITTHDNSNKIVKRLIIE